MASPPPKGRGGQRHRLLYNNDRGFFYYLEPSAGVEGIVHELVGRVRGTRVDTLAARIDRGNLVPLYDSRIEGKVGRGYTTFPTMEIWRHVTCMRRLLDQGIDPWQKTFEAARQAGMAAFAGIRMNDLHHTKQNPAYEAWKPFYVSEVARNPRYFIGEDYAHWSDSPTLAAASQLLSFVHEEVRQHRLNIIEELIERYDLDGVELDFQRHSLFFAQSQVECGTPLMTDLIRQVRAVLDRFEQQRNHPICLFVRVPSWIEGCLEAGLDVPTWIRDGLVDMVGVSSVCETEFDAPLEPFVELARGTHCEILPTIEYMTWPPYRKWLPQMARAGAAWYYRQGADGIALYNCQIQHGQFFDSSDGTLQPYNQVDFQGLFSELHDPQALRYGNKRYTASVRSRHFPTYQKQLPAEFRRDQVGTTHRVIMKLAEDTSAHLNLREAVDLRVRITNVSEEDGFAVSFNGHPVPTVAMRLRHGYPNDSALMIYPLNPAWIVMGENTVEVKLTKSNQAVATAMQLVGVEVQFNYRQIPIQVATD